MAFCLLYTVYAYYIVYYILSTNVYKCIVLTIKMKVKNKISEAGIKMKNIKSKKRRALRKKDGVCTKRQRNYAEIRKYL